MGHFSPKEALVWQVIILSKVIKFGVLLTSNLTHSNLTTLHEIEGSLELPFPPITGYLRPLYLKTINMVTGKTHFAPVLL